MAATTPIIPRVIKTSASVNAERGERGKVKGEMENGGGKANPPNL